MSRVQLLRRRSGLVVLVALGALLLGCTPPPFGLSEGGTRYSDNSTLTYRSIECNDADHNKIQPYVHLTMLYDITTTDITTSGFTRNACGSGTDNPNDDIYWFAAPEADLVAISGTPGTTGLASCMSTSGVTHPSSQCQRYRVMFAEHKTNFSNITCHEFAHALGFGHGDTELSCMDGGNNGIFDQYMIGRINDRY